MARRRSIMETLASDEAATDEQSEQPVAEAKPDAPAAPEEAPPAAAKKTTAPKKTATRGAGRAKTARAAKSQPAEKTQSADKTGESGQAGAARPGPRVLVPESTASAGRISLYLHEDDKDWIQFEARRRAGADVNAIFRALIALYRYDERLQARVDKLARNEGSK